MTEKSIFSLIEKEMGEQLPEPLAFILNETGFSTNIALKCINPDSSIQPKLWKIEQWTHRHHL